MNSNFKIPIIIHPKLAVIKLLVHSVIKGALANSIGCTPQVCQIGVMIDLDIVTLNRDGDFDFMTITVFLFTKVDRQPFFLAIAIK